MKACVNLLWVHRLSLRDAHLHLQHRHFCSRSALTPPHRGVCAVSDSEYSRTCISTCFLLARMNFSCVHSTNSVLLFAHRSLTASPSALSTIVSPEGCTGRHTHRWGLNQQSCVSISAGHVCAESRPAVFAIQRRSLHRNAQFEECVSALNEARCRRSLQANAALYKRDTHRWAAVLVCLCVSRGDPALLFTLRSAQLKGRHKGDVRYKGSGLPLLRNIRSAFGVPRVCLSRFRSKYPQIIYYTPLKIKIKINLIQFLSLKYHSEVI